MHYTNNTESHIRNLEPNCQYSSSSYSITIVAKSLQPPQNLYRPLKTFACVYLRYRKHHGGVGGDSGCACDKNCGKMCGKIEKLLD